MARKKIKTNNVEILVESLGTVEKNGLHCLTATINKEGKPGDNAVVTLCISQFPEVLELIKTALQKYEDTVLILPR